MKRKIVKETAERLARNQGQITAGSLAEELGITRQTAHRHLRALVEEGLFERRGQGRGSHYVSAGVCHRDSFAVGGLDEDAVYDQLRRWPPLVGLPSTANEVLHYVVTELVNNVIDHSGGTRLDVKLEVGVDTLCLDFVDDGVGLFDHIRERLALEDSLHALQQLTKGKTTTAPEAHSGEGIFFVSRCADRFEIDSGGLRWVRDNRIDDWAVGTGAVTKGTRVRFDARPSALRPLQEVFARYTDTDLAFNRTETLIKLFELGAEFVSRSQAKRLTVGLEKFARVVLDFRDVQLVGQGFADEVFRVWSTRHPGVSLEPIHMSDPVAFFVNRARQSRPSSR